MHTFITYIADRSATREVEGLTDFYGLASLVTSGELTYDEARDGLVIAFNERNLSAGTAKTYLSQAHSIAQVFPTFDEVESFADDECDGSRSLKRIYSAMLVKDDEPTDGEDDGEGEGEGEGDATTDADRADAILSILSGMTDADAIRTVLDAASGMLKASPVAA